jgi:hypothetical protein
MEAANLVSEVTAAAEMCRRMFGWSPFVSIPTLPWIVSGVVVLFGSAWSVGAFGAGIDPSIVDGRCQ